MFCVVQWLLKYHNLLPLSTFRQSFQYSFVISWRISYAKQTKNSDQKKSEIFTHRLAIHVVQKQWRIAQLLNQSPCHTSSHSFSSRAASSKRPLLSVDASAGVCVCNVWSRTKRFSGSCLIGTPQESAYGASISDVIDDVTWLWHHNRDATIFKVVAFGNQDPPDQLSVWTL